MSGPSAWVSLRVGGGAVPLSCRGGGHHYYNVDGQQYNNADHHKPLTPPSCNQQHDNDIHSHLQPMATTLAHHLAPPRHLQKHTT
ncbi:hypothetical protein SCLCIDRAFT_1216914 [Scleroderma citrinum Foug A]|uniref:Uncharacterized protein n=1 Tax=Scleroderma citrinum Foug A TaxID=1036808 RepID=A0A0C3A6C8_9AGAM|nr:hypothetical protein SCLCIDRAFT_1216914 [Scleroderma citrinum Foug A]